MCYGSRNTQTDTGIHTQKHRHTHTETQTQTQTHTDKMEDASSANHLLQMRFERAWLAALAAAPERGRKRYQAKQRQSARSWIRSQPITKPPERKKERKKEDVHPPPMTARTHAHLLVCDGNRGNDVDQPGL